jgi:hypothetical protein
MQYTFCMEAFIVSESTLNSASAPHPSTSLSTYILNILKLIGSDNYVVIEGPLTSAEMQHLEIARVESAWERFGKELEASRHEPNRAESAGHSDFVHARNPKVVSSNRPPQPI